MAAIHVVAGCNGAGKSSIGGAALRAAGAAYFNPDEAARAIVAANASRPVPMSQAQANAAAWAEGRRLLERAIHQRGNFAFETTLGGQTMTELLLGACAAGVPVHMWFAGLATAEMHIERVRQRVAQGGHDIPEATIRARFDRGRENLVRLLPHLAALRLFDNSAPADPARGRVPRPRLLVEVIGGRITAPREVRTLVAQTPPWAKPVVAAALKLHLRRQRQPLA